MNRVRVGSRSIGPGQPCFVIAEAGVNHNGDLSLAKKMIDVAARAGADAVKFQTFRATRLVTAEAPKASYQARATGTAEGQQAMLRRLELDEPMHRELMEHARGQGILFLSTPFEEASADLLERLGVEAFKVPSGEVPNLPFLAHLARKGKPLLVSTGMCTLAEVDEAVRCVRSSGSPPLALFHCVSSYPARAEDANLRAMATMERAFGVPVGFSDHTLGLEVGLAAVACGASLLEKHFTLDRGLPGPDHQASLTPDELAALVRGVRRVEAALGHGRKEPVEAERDTAAVARKSLVIARPVSAGTPVTPEHILIQRPGTGLPPSALRFVVGRIAKQDIGAGTLLEWGMLQ